MHAEWFQLSFSMADAGRTFRDTDRMFSLVNTNNYITKDVTISHGVETSLRLRSPVSSDTVRIMSLVLAQALFFGNGREEWNSATWVVNFARLNISPSETV